MTCDVCGKSVTDRREHRHTADRPELRAAENYGRMKAQQERDWIRSLVRRAELDHEIASENATIKRIEERP
jgi:hypothetical protein